MGDRPESRPDRPRGDRVVVIGPDESARAIRTSLAEVSAGAPRDLVVDLRAVVGLTNPELAVLVGVRGRQRAQHGTLTLVVDPGSAAERALARAGLWGSFTTAEEVPAPRDDPPVCPPS